MGNAIHGAAMPGKAKAPTAGGATPRRRLRSFKRKPRRKRAASSCNACNRAARRPGRRPRSAGGGMNISFAPHITVNAGVPAGVKHSRCSRRCSCFAEFERLMRRYEADRQQRSYSARASRGAWRASAPAPVSTYLEGNPCTRYWAISSLI